MEVDILKEALGLLKKDQGINMMKLKNHEKVVVIDAAVSYTHLTLPTN